MLGVVTGNQSEEHEECTQEGKHGYAPHTYTLKTLVLQRTSGFPIHSNLSIELVTLTMIEAGRVVL